ncbi:GH92 family glycosyl hydrolase [Prolixibacteraceae bacterium Z1-6]|uniref:GH92 family glycosyl hydrolase n=1 Tax=Draconibacterium aestuarii TaxID=2998507 RepID=A0A9X3FII8_9BACT|nr:GH92 family glycosyl hydrolase [Prolixibacteraceae bacterium Z1-6]
MCKHILKLFTILLSGLFIQCSSPLSPADYTTFVNPYIGSDGHGHVFVGANVPFGAVQLGPNNEREEWDWCSGYHFSDSLLIGFAHTHLSGTGIGDLGDILFMPVSGNFQSKKDSATNYPWISKYTHEDEIVKPGYYSLKINRYNILAELTATERVGFHKYNYKATGNSQLIIDLEYGTGWDAVTQTQLRQTGDNSICGSRFSTGWAKNQQLFFYTEFSKKIKTLDILSSDKKTGINTVLIEFEGNGELLAKTSISPTSIEGAKNNMQTELNHWDFEATKGLANSKWNTELSKIKVTTENPRDKKIFYTSLYHTMFVPSLYNDSNADYRGTDREIKKNPGHNTYTTFSLWDTYRAAHPLYTIYQPDRVNDMVNSMLDIYHQQGKLPVWHLHGNETNTMVGNHAIPVIVDAYLKGFREFDAEDAFEAMKRSALLQERGLNFLQTSEYIPADSMIESVAIALEYAIDDWCIAAMAKKLNKTADFELFSKRAEYYKHYFDRKAQFMRGKMADGTWRTPFDPVASKHRDDDYCEGNAWQYSWLVPHDVEGLIQLIGGDKAFTARLDSLFSTEQKLNEGASVDISGLIGMYAQGNEPGHHIPYLYAYAGEQWKTAQKINFILNNMYFDTPNGLSGNEDCGQMSAWYVFSSLGFYPVNPAKGMYVFGSPLFDNATIQLPGNKTFEIKTVNRNRINIYIQKIKLNGTPYFKSYINHSDIVNGGTLEITMGSTPNKYFGTDMGNRPNSAY